MDILTLEKALEAKTVPALGRIVGQNFSGYDSLEGLKRGILVSEGVQRSVKICENKEEEIASIIEGIHTYNSDQQEFIDLLNKRGIVGVPEDPIPEEKSDTETDKAVFAESATRIYNAMKMADSSSDMTPEDTKNFVVEQIQKELKNLTTE